MGTDSPEQCKSVAGYHTAVIAVRYPELDNVQNDFFFALCCLGKIPGGAPFSQLHKSGNGSRVDRP